MRRKIGYFYNPKTGKKTPKPSRRKAGAARTQNHALDPRARRCTATSARAQAGLDGHSKLAQGQL